MAGILDRANLCLLPEGPDSSEASPAKGEVHRRLWGPILRFFGADLVVGVGSQASVAFPLDEREGIDFFEAQHSNLQDVVDATQRIDSEYCGTSHKGGLAESSGTHSEADSERFARLRATSGFGQSRISGDINGTRPDEQQGRQYDFPHCSICPGRIGGRGLGHVPLPARKYPTCWDEYVQHAVDYQRGPRTCPTCRKRLVSRSPFRSPFGPLDGTVEEGSVFKGLLEPVRARPARGEANHEGAAVPAGGESPRSKRGTNEIDAGADRGGTAPMITEWWCSSWAPPEGSRRHCAPT